MLSSARPRPSLARRATWGGILLATLALSLAPAHGHADDKVSKTKVWNSTGSNITVYFQALGCAGFVNDRTLVCHSKALAPGESASYTWLWGQTAKKYTASCIPGKQWSAVGEAHLTDDAGGACGTSSGAPPAPPAPPPRVYFKLVHKATGLCLDPAHYDARQGRTVGLYQCEAQLDQTFYQEYGGDYIFSAKSNLVLDVNGHAGSAGDTLFIYGADNGDDQRWDLGSRIGWSRVKNLAKNLCLQAEAGQRAVLATCDGSDKQQWAQSYHPH